MLLDRPSYILRKRVFTLFGAKVEVFDPQGNVVMFIKQKAFKLREDVRVYSDNTMEEELLLIKARQILDVAARYDVIDQTTGEHVGVLHRRGFKSMVRDTWDILTPDEEQMAVLHEDHPLLAMIRRFVTDMVPQSFSLFAGEEEICRITQNFNPFVKKLRVYMRAGDRLWLDPRLILATAVLLILIEGRQ